MKEGKTMPATCDELLSELRSARAELLEVLESIPEAERETPGACGAWTVKDVLVHLNHWEGEMVTLLYTLKRGAPITSILLDPKLDVDACNARWVEMAKDRPWERVWSDFLGVHTQLLRRTAEFRDDQLFQPGLHPRLGKTPLWRLIAVCAFEHEREHAAGLRAWKGSLKNVQSG